MRNSNQDSNSPNVNRITKASVIPKFRRGWLIFCCQGIKTVGRESCWYRQVAWDHSRGSLSHTADWGFSPARRSSRELLQNSRVTSATFITTDISASVKSNIRLVHLAWQKTITKRNRKYLKWDKFSLWCKNCLMVASHSYAFYECVYWNNKKMHFFGKIMIKACFHLLDVLITRVT